MHHRIKESCIYDCCSRRLVYQYPSYISLPLATLAIQFTLQQSPPCSIPHARVRILILFHHQTNPLTYFVSIIRASFCTLTISVTNLTILTILHGKELVWICLGSCSTDVLVNALVLFWLTRPRHNGDEQSSGAVAGIQGRIRSDQGKSGGGYNLRPVSAPVPSNNGKSHKTAEGSPNTKERPFSIKVDLESGDGREQYGEVYDGSSQRLRTDQLGSPILASPTLSSGHGARKSGSPTHFTYPPLSPPPTSYQQQQYKRHSVGFYEDKKANKTNGAAADRHSFLEGFDRDMSNSSARSIGLLERLGLRSLSPAFAKDDLARYPGLRAMGGVGMKKKRSNSDEGENMKVRITITTHMENDEDDLHKEVEATHRSRNTSTSSV
jgi:hypothetical protein